MLDINWTAASTIVALGLGLLSLWFGQVKPSREMAAARAIAALEVRWELFWRKDTQRIQHRLIVRNLGPHAAEGVEVVALLDPDGALTNIRPASTNPLPVRVLQPAQEHHSIYDLAINELVGEVELGWTDGRGRHVESFTLSPQYV